jgi:hypothetical protein
MHYVSGTSLLQTTLSSVKVQSLRIVAAQRFVE